MAVPIKYLLTADADGKVVQVEADQMTRDLITIGHEHHEIHEGDHYFIGGYATFAADEDIDFQVTTPKDGRQMHITFSFQTTGATTLDIYEGANVDADGTGMTAYNNNRNSQKTTSCQLIQYDGTINSAGTVIYSAAWGQTDTPVSSTGGIAGRSQELILKENTTYRFFVQSDSAANIISYSAEWYEHPNNFTNDFYSED